MTQKYKIAQVILPVPLSGSYSYVIPEHMNIQLGSRVIVEFGNKKIYSGLVISIQDNPENSSYKLKYIQETLDDNPIVTSQQLALLHWLASYYMCNPGEVMMAMLPSQLKLNSEAILALKKETTEEISTELTDKERTILTLLKRKELSLKEVSDQLKQKNILKYVRNLTDKNLIDIYEKIKDKYRPKSIKRLRLTDTYSQMGAIESLINSLESKMDLQEFIINYLKIINLEEFQVSNRFGTEKSTFLSDEKSKSVYLRLKKRAIFEEFIEVIDRYERIPFQSEKLPELTFSQTRCLSEIKQIFLTWNTVLLFGKTGSGKTLLYMHLIAEEIEKGHSVLLLLPEIALTTQIVDRFRQVFGGQFAVYHSKISDNERTELYKSVANGNIQFVIGVRSSLFLPFRNLGLIIVDEEHDTSYKQHEPAPRYHARDSAVFLAGLHHAKILLGSATPSLETFANTQAKKYGLSKLDERFNSTFSPDIQCIDLGKAHKQRKIRGSFTTEILDEITKILSKKQQAIIFQNRRGYAPFILCRDCGHTPKCMNCEVSLTYHLFQNKLICHYCGFQEQMESACRECGSTSIQTVGNGTEKLEEELEILIPEAKITRMDLDTTRSKNALQDIIDSFSSGKTDILIGTQMVTKGLDFDKVSLVGIFDTDRILHYPDFRSHERAFHLLTQVSGRAGRKQNQGKILIQTYHPSHPVIQSVKNGEIETFYQKELHERQIHQFPPYYRMILCVIKSKDEQMANHVARLFIENVHRHILPIILQGPLTPYISKIRNYHIRQALIKFDPQKISTKELKQRLKMSRKSVLDLPDTRQVQLYFDVDPQ